MVAFANLDPVTSTIAAAVIQAIGTIIAAAITAGLAYVIWRGGRERESKLEGIVSGLQDQIREMGRLLDFAPNDQERLEQLKDEILEDSGLVVDDAQPSGPIAKKRGSFVLLLGDLWCLPAVSSIFHGVAGPAPNLLRLGITSEEGCYNIEVHRRSRRTASRSASVQ